MEQDASEVLEEIIKSVNDLIIETKRQYRELQVTKQRLENLHKNNKVSQFDYVIEKERIQNSEKSVDDCLRQLARQKKIATFELMKLDSE